MESIYVGRDTKGFIATTVKGYAAATACFCCEVSSGTTSVSGGKNVECRGVVASSVSSVPAEPSRWCASVKDQEGFIGSGAS